MEGGVERKGRKTGVEEKSKYGRKWRALVTFLGGMAAPAEHHWRYLSWLHLARDVLGVRNHGATGQGCQQRIWINPLLNKMFKFAQFLGKISGS